MDGVDVAQETGETKQQPSMLTGPAVPGFCLVSFRFLFPVRHPLCEVYLQIYLAEKILLLTHGVIAAFESHQRNKTPSDPLSLKTYALRDSIQ